MAEGEVSSSEDKPKLKGTVALAGKRGIGKSTLINELLHLTKDKEAKTSYSVNPTTIKVNIYEEIVDEVTWKIIDVPGLGFQEEEERRDIMAQLIAKTAKKADLLLYCVCMNTGCSIDDTDIEILKLLRWVFGKGLFQHCILVFTMANVIEAIHGREKVSETTQDLANHFQEALRKAGIPGIEVRAIQSNTDEDYTGMLGIPVGLKDDDPILPNKKWKESLAKEITKKFRSEGDSDLDLFKIKGYRKALLMKFFHITGLMDTFETRDSGVGPTMHLERANAKEEVKAKLAEKKN